MVGEIVSQTISSFVSGLFSNYTLKLSPEERFFSNVIGYQDVKKVFFRSIRCKELVHVLLTGPPSTSKTVFLLEMVEKINGSYFVDALGASGAGMIDHLFNNNTKYLLIDEIDKLKKE